MYANTQYFLGPIIFTRRYTRLSGNVRSRDFFLACLFLLIREREIGRVICIFRSLTMRNLAASLNMLKLFLTGTWVRKLNASTRMIHH